MQNGDTKVYGEQISYVKVGDHATNRVSGIRYGKQVNNVYGLTEGIKYSYDKMGNISEIWSNGELVARYEYDSINRLVREDNKVLNITEFITYDNCGNILNRRQTNYTLLPESEIISAFEKTNFAYNGDRLLAIDDTNVTYDNFGNPTSYKGKTLTWANGKHLTNYDTTAFTYDGCGKRIKKGDIVFTYDSNNNLIKQSDGTNELEFIYDNSGLCGVKQGTTNYIYRKNVFGDITDILDMSGEVVAKYTYDAWGNHIVTNIGNNTIGEVNPFRYRSYYFDTETNLYYLQTRYYDPETGRFISQDDVTYLDPEHINGLNLYAYCCNNPVNLSDSTGCSPWWDSWWGKLLIGVGVIAVLAIATIATAGIAGVGIGAAFGAGFAGAAIGAGASGLAVTIAAGAFAGAVIGAGIGLVSGAVIGGLTTGTWQGTLDGAAGGFMMGAITGAVGAKFEYY